MRDDNLELPMLEHQWSHRGGQRAPWVPFHDSTEWVKKDCETTCVSAESAVRENGSGNDASDGSRAEERTWTPEGHTKGQEEGGKLDRACKSWDGVWEVGPRNPEVEPYQERRAAVQDG